MCNVSSPVGFSERHRTTSCRFGDACDVEKHDGRESKLGKFWESEDHE